MRHPDLEVILHAMLDLQPSVSDLVFIVGRLPQVEIDGELVPVQVHPALRQLSGSNTEKIALSLVGDNQRLLRELIVRGNCDCSYQLGERARFRINIFRQRGQFGIVMRRTATQVPTLESLDLPPVFKEIVHLKSGLVLVTGASGSGKTCTISAILDEINRTQSVHVVTLEDPVEFVHQHGRATFTQREFGTDFEDFATGLRSALRQAPKVILVGEMRDRATMEIALAAAETGHLVLSTLHTGNASQAILRLTGMFEQCEQVSMRLRLMETLRYVISQRLVPRLGGGRYLVQEIMGSNLRVREAIALGENESRSFYEMIDASAPFGWRTFDQSLAQAYLDEQISEETALLYAVQRNRLARHFEEAKKRAGNMNAPFLQLNPESVTGPVPATSGLRLSN